ncbi:MAG: sulfatase [Pirellulales bacterium]|nr:sulfatase [Pirellulales bacterium]
MSAARRWTDSRWLAKVAAALATVLVVGVLAVVYGLLRGFSPLDVLVWNPSSGRDMVIVMTVILSAPLWFFAPGEGRKSCSIGNTLRWILVLAAVNSTALIAIRLVKQPLVNPFITASRDTLVVSDWMWWIVPASQVCGLLLLALYTLGVGRIFTGIAVGRALLFIVLLATCFDVVPLIANGKLEGVAELLLIFGLVAAGLRSRWLLSRFETRPKPWLVAIALAILIGLPAGYWAVQVLGRTTPSPVAARPNILLITLDTVRKQNLSLYGYSRQTTPQLERFAKRGVVYTNAIAPSSWTLPTHASIFTSLLPLEHGAEQVGLGLQPHARTLAESLRESGYATAGFVANDMCGKHTGLAQGFQYYDELKPWWCGSIVTAATAQFLGGVPRRTAADINRSFLKWLDRQRGQPFFAFLNYYDAHGIYEVPDPSFDRFSTATRRERRKLKTKWSIADVPFRPDDPSERQYAIDSYDGAIAYLDDQLGRLFDALQRQGLLDNTIVVVTNDHGEHFGENGKWEHSDSLYRQLIDAPLIIVYPPKIAADAVVEQPVTLTQIPATLVELVGLEKETAFRGASLPTAAPLAGGAVATVQLDLIFSETCPNQEDRSEDRLCSIVANGWHYIRRCSDGDEELYDYRADPLESHNLADEPRFQDNLTSLRGLLLQNYPGRGSDPTTSAQVVAPRQHVPAWVACRCGCCRPPGALGLFLYRLGP